MNAPSDAGPKRQLGLFDASCIMVGIIIGSGIYKTTPMIAANVGSANALIFVWLLGGAIAFLGALCYAELTTSYPEEGGDYVFITRAFGKQAGFLFAWAEYWIVRPGNVGMMAFVFATFAQGLFTPSSSDGTRIPDFVYAVGAIVLLTIVNVLGVQTGKTTQNILATAKVIGLAAIVFVGLFMTPADPGVMARFDSNNDQALTSTEVPSNWWSRLSGADADNDQTLTGSELQNPPPPSTDYRLAIILVLFTYGGWSEISYVAAEVRRPERNLFRALLLGIVLVTALYVFVNVAFVRTLGWIGTSVSDQVAADVMEVPFGVWGAKAMSLLVCVSALGAVNGMLFTGARIYYAVGNDNPLVAWLGRWSGRMDSPVRALILQAIISVALIVAFGWYEEGFLRLTYFTTPVYWFFAFMVGISLMVLRWRDSDRPRPHKVWLYPWVPLTFCLICAVLCESSFTFALSQRHMEAAWAIGLMLAGVAVAVVFKQKEAS